MQKNGLQYAQFAYGEKSISNHGGPVTAAVFEGLDRYNANWRKAIADDPVKVQASFKDQFESMLNNETAGGASAPNLLFSGELFSAYTEPDMERLSEVLEPHCDRLRVLVYVRNPLSFYGSLVQETVKAGQPDNFGTLNGLMSSRYTRLANVFGDRLEVLDFDQHIRQPGGLMGSFLSVCGLPEKSLRKIENPVYNTRVSLEAFRLMRQLNKIYPLREQDGQRSTVRVHRDSFPLHGLPGTRFSLAEYRNRPLFKSVLNEVAWYEETFGVELASKLPETAVDDWGPETIDALPEAISALEDARLRTCLLYTSPSPRDQRGSRMPSSA